MLVILTPKYANETNFPSINNPWRIQPEYFHVYFLCFSRFPHYIVMCMCTFCWVWKNYDFSWNILIILPWKMLKRATIFREFFCTNFCTCDASWKRSPRKLNFQFYEKSLGRDFHGKNLMKNSRKNSSFWWMEKSIFSILKSWVSREYRWKIHGNLIKNLMKWKKKPWFNFPNWH
jgi:hypothetical protein